MIYSVVERHYILGYVGHTFNVYSCVGDSQHIYRYSYTNKINMIHVYVFFYVYISMQKKMDVLPLESNFFLLFTFSNCS